LKVSFVDEADIVVESGSGGDGSIHFHRSRFLPKGGPDGGDGGRGGNIIVFTKKNLSDLSKYLHKRFFKAQSGEPGGSNRQHGKNGKDLRLPVPVGTQIYEGETGELLCDLDTPIGEFVVAHGGKGGRGNVHYKNPVRQAPRIAQEGLPGKRLRLRLTYKMKTDVGLIGPPNAGKSSLLCRITSSKSRVAEYPFTTRVPQLGVYVPDISEPITFVEIPALGSGPNRRFLKHVERSHLLLILLELSEEKSYRDILDDLRVLLSELEAYGEGLEEKLKILGLNKSDAVKKRDALKSLARRLEKETGFKTLAFSAITGEGLEELLSVVRELVY